MMIFKAHEITTLRIPGKTLKKDQPIKLLTADSNFPSLKLPPLGIRTPSLVTENYTIGQEVLVRRIVKILPTPEWSDWVAGKIIVAGVWKGNLAIEGEVFGVEIQHSGRKCVVHHHFGEMWPAQEQLPPSEVFVQRFLEQQKISCRVYARFDSVWVATKLLHSRPQGRSDIYNVLCLTGPNRGSRFWVNDILPYTLETMQLCTEQGCTVMNDDGSMMGPVPLGRV